MVHTHELTFDGTLVTKRYRSWARGEHRREWSVLHHVHRHAPGLAPRPLSADLDAVPPTVTMTVVPGEPLPAVPSPAQLDALADAIGELWAVPAHSPAVDPWTDDLDFARRLTDGPALGRAYDAARSWWDGPDPELLRTRPAVTVLGHRDPNLA